MSSSETDLREALAENVAVDEHTIIVDLSDGRTITVPTAWFPRLLHGTQTERGKWRLIGRGEGIHWPELDEDISIRLLAGYRSGESQDSLRGWLAARQ